MQVKMSCHNCWSEEIGRRGDFRMTNRIKSKIFREFYKQFNQCERNANQTHRVQESALFFSAFLLIMVIYGVATVSQRCQLPCSIQSFFSFPFNHFLVFFIMVHCFQTNLNPETYKIGNYLRGFLHFIYFVFVAKAKQKKLPIFKR